MDKAKRPLCFFYLCSSSQVGGDEAFLFLPIQSPTSNYLCKELTSRDEIYIMRNFYYLFISLVPRHIKNDWHLQLITKDYYFCFDRNLTPWPTPSFIESSNCNDYLPFLHFLFFILYMLLYGMTIHHQCILLPGNR